MQIIITGGLGHIGSRLIRELPLALPQYQITIIDNLLTERYVSLFELPKNCQYRFIEADLMQFDLNQLEPNIYAIIHLAAITNAEKSVDIPDLVKNHNFGLTKKIANFCAEKNINLFFPSSTSVYGSQKELVDESEAIDLKPQSPYAATKIAEENLLLELARTKNLKVFIARLATIYGKSIGMRFHTAVNKFCWQAAFKQPLTVWETAFEQKRPYLDLTDAINAIIFALKKPVFDGEIYNIVTGNYTVKQIVNIIQQKIPDLKINFVTSKIMNQLSYEVDNNKIKNKGFMFSGDITTGIQQTLDLLKYA